MSPSPGQPDSRLIERITASYARGPAVPPEVDRAVLAAMAAQSARWPSRPWRGWAAAAAIGLLAGTAAWLAVRPSPRPDMVSVLQAARSGTPPEQLRAMAAGAVRIGGGS